MEVQVHSAAFEDPRVASSTSLLEVHVTYTLWSFVDDKAVVDVCLKYQRKFYCQHLL